jgi:AraC-like DNA-binding protein
MEEQLSIIGRNFYPGLTLMCWYNLQETFSNLGVGSRFRLVLVERGSGILQFGQYRQIFLAPTLFCLNEQEHLGLEQAVDLKAQALYFHPSVVNSVFTFENIRGNFEGFTATEVQDNWLFRAFLRRDEQYNGQLRIDPMTAQHIVYLIRAANREMTQQDNDKWPCSGRSFLLELLIVVGRLASHGNRASLSEDQLSGPAGDVDPVILHLLTHYNEKLTVGDLSRQFHTNRTTLTERFRKTTGVPVMTYLAQLRIRMASSMLHDTSLPICEVAGRVGFKDLTHFGRTFRKYMGCTPSEYRERYCWMLR